MKTQHLTTLSQAARELRIDRKTVADLVRIFKIPTYPVATNGLAKGIDQSGMKRLRKVLPVTSN